MFIDCVVAANRTGKGGAGFVSASGSLGSRGGDGGSGAGFYVSTSSVVTLLRCTILENLTGVGGVGGSSVLCVPPLTCLTFGQDGGNGGDGGGISLGSPVQAVNCLFVDNATGDGGAAGFGLSLPLAFPGRGGNGGAWNGGDSSSKLTQCTLRGNSTAPFGDAGQPAGSGGGIQGTPRVVNSILWENDPTQVPAGASVNYSIVQGGHTGIGNLDQDPRFVAPGTGNLRLGSNSPGIDHGDNAALPAGVSTDLDGHQRIQDGDGDQIARVDLGPYEFVDPTDVEVLSEASTSLSASFSAGGSGPVRIRYHLGRPAFEIRLDVFTVAGRHVRSLERGGRDGGEHSVAWDRRDETGVVVARGVYFLVLDDRRVRIARRVVLLAR
jgi:hypothetical protein